MMSITRSNYESWFLDYIEGNLDGKLMDEFIEFIRSNPDLGEELRKYVPVKLKKGPVVFDGKNKLYKERLDIPSQFDHEAVAFMEGDLILEESIHFQDYMSRHPEKSPEMDSFLKTKLLPDVSLVFNRKQKLVKKTGQSVLLAWTRRVAAILLLLLALYTWSDQPVEEIVKETQPDQIAEIIPSESGPEKPDSAPLVQKITTGASGMARLKPKAAKVTGKSIKRNTSVESVTAEVASAENLHHETPAMLPVIPAIVSLNLPAHELALAKFENDRILPEDHTPASQYLSERVIEKLRLNEINLSKVLRTGLDLVVQLTNEKFSYNKDLSGKVTEYQLETRLLGFSLPVGKSGQ